MGQWWTPVTGLVNTPFGSTFLTWNPWTTGQVRRRASGSVKLLKSYGNHDSHFFPIQLFWELSSEQLTSISSWIPQESQFRLTHNELTTSPCSESVCGFAELVIQSKNLGVIVDVIFFVIAFIQAVTKSCEFYLLKAFKRASSFHLCCLCCCQALTLSVLNTYSSDLVASFTGLLPP